MNTRDQSIEPGTVYIAPSGRRVEFVGIDGGAYLFAYLDSDETFALSRAGVSILYREAV